MAPHVSVILPYYEGDKWLLKSVDSVRSQEDLSFEIIVVDDGSSRPAAPILSTLADDRIRAVRIPHAGKGAALNEGARMARADVLCFIDQDDLMNANRLRLQYSAFFRHPRIDAVYSDYERVGENGMSIDVVMCRQATNDECLHQMAIGRGLVTMQTLMIRKETFWKIGGFSEDIYLTGLDDAEFFARLFTSNVVLAYVPGIVQKWVDHGKNYMKSESFHKARLILLDHLENLALKNTMIRKELPYFRYHTYYMRGLYVLEHDQPEEAISQWWRAIIARPVQLDAYYMFIKSFLRKLLK